MKEKCLSNMDGNLTRESWVCPQMDRDVELWPVAARFSQEL